MVITDNQLIGNSSYSNGSTVIMERRTEQAKASGESAISERVLSKIKRVMWYLFRFWMLEMACIQ